MKRLVAAVLAALLIAAPAYAQTIIAGAPAGLTPGGSTGDIQTNGGSGILGHVTIVPVGNGGSGLATITSHDVLIGEGTSALTPITPGTSGWVLTSNGTSADPSFQAPSGGGSLSAIAADNILGNFTGSSATPIAGAVPNCVGSSALTYATSTHAFGCLMGIASGAGLGANTFTGEQTITQGTANTPTLASTGFSATSTNTTALLDLAGTFGGSGAAAGIRINMTCSSCTGNPLILDVQKAGTSIFNVNGFSQLVSMGALSVGGNTTSTGSVTIGGASTFAWTARGFITSPAAGAVQIGNTDAASPVAQTLSAQSVTGVANTAGQALIIQASRGSGSGSGGDVVFKVAPAGSAGGTTPNSTVTALTISNKGVPALPGYTVSTLPTSPPTGSLAYVTDSTSCTYGGALTGGGSTYCKVSYSGSTWVGG